jgi:hypothetical protein
MFPDVSSVFGQIFADVSSIFRIFGGEPTEFHVVFPYLPPQSQH